MTKIDYLNIAVKIFGLYFIVLFVSSISELTIYLISATYSDQNIEWNFYSFQILGQSIRLIIGLVLFLKSGKISGYVNQGADGNQINSIQKQDLIEIAFLVISVLALIYSIPELLNLLVHKVYIIKDEEASFWLPDARITFFNSLFTLVTGLFLMLNANNLAKWLIKREQRDS